MTCSEVNCDHPVKVRQLCSTHYWRWYRTGHTSETPAARSLRVNREAWGLALTEAAKESGECWLWPGSTSPDGYGLSRRNGEKLAHRSAWVQVYGPIPDGLIICHRCDTPRCYRVSHLFLGTHADNTADKMRKGRMFIGDGRLDRRVGLADEEAERIRESPEPAKALALRFGVSVQHVRNIRAGQRRLAPTGVTPGRGRRWPEHAAHEETAQ